MSARAIGSATISFGLVSVPVKLYSASDSSASISFNLIHKDCGSRVKTQYYCPKDEVVVPRDELVKGYEVAKDQYVLFTQEELKALDAQSDDSISIAEFIPRDQIDWSYLDRTYYLGPDKGGARAYRLLSAAMQDTGLSGLGRYAARGKQYLVLVHPKGDGLVMEQLKYADDIRSFSEVPLGEGEVKKEELKLAKQFIEQVASKKFEPGKYEDEVRARVLELIQKKVEGEDITAAPEAAPETKIIDLMEALKASLDQTEKKPAKRASSGSKKKPAKKRKAGGAS
ncbi:MAG: Ku protein [Gemmatimonadota bacterium]